MDEQVRSAVADIAMSMQSANGVGESLGILTRRAVEIIPGVDFASITVKTGDGRLETLAPTDEVVVRLDQLQYDLQEGPCYDAATGEEILVCDDLADDPRWPTYGPRAAELGVRSQIGLELVTDETRRAALNLYGAQVAPFDGGVEVARLFASHAGLTMGFVRSVEELRNALRTRKVIGQAIGIVMERYSLSEDRAFQFLVRLSQSGNVKLRTVADDLVSSLNRQADSSKTNSPDDGASLN